MPLLDLDDEQVEVIAILGRAEPRTTLPPIFTTNSANFVMDTVHLGPLQPCCKVRVFFANLGPFAPVVVGLRAEGSSYLFI